MSLQLAAGPARRGAKPQPDGWCTCTSHKDGAWDRSEHWTRDEVFYLEASFGSVADATIARRLKRTIIGIRLKAKRLGLTKKSAGLTASDVADIFGVDRGVPGKIWVARGLMRSKRPYAVGKSRIHFVDEAEVERFIRDHGEWVDVDRMPDSPYRDLAVAGGRWHSVADVMRLTGRHPHVLDRDLAAGRFPARKRGPHWMVHESTIEAIAATAGYLGRYASVDRRDRTLEHRRNVRKGVETPRPPEKTRIIRLRLEDCYYCRGRGFNCSACDGKGKVLVPTLRGRVGALRLPDGWAA